MTHDNLKLAEYAAGLTIFIFIAKPLRTVLRLSDPTTRTQELSSLSGITVSSKAPTPAQVARGRLVERRFKCARTLILLWLTCAWTTIEVDAWKAKHPRVEAPAPIHTISHEQARFVG